MFGAPASKYQLQELALCVTFAARHYRVVVRTNLVESVLRLGLPCMVQQVAFERLRPWSVHKLRSYLQASDTEPYLHIDSDVFLVDPLPEWLFEGDGLVAQNPEGISLYPGIDRAFAEWREKYVPKPFRAYNCGILGGNPVVVREYAQLAIEAAEAAHFPLLPTWAEQVMAGHFEARCLFTEAVALDGSIYAGYIHLMRASDDPSIQARVAARLRTENPKVANLLSPVVKLRDRRTTVAFLTPCFHVGGAETWIAGLCRNLDPERFRPIAVHVDHARDTSEEAVEWLPRGVDIRIGSTPDADVVLTWGLMDLRRRIERVKGIVIDVQHGAKPTIEWQIPVAAEAARAHRERGVLLTAVNEVCRPNFPEDVRSAVTVIPNGADPAKVHPLAREWDVRNSLGIRSESNVALFVGRVHPDKNVQVLIDAIAELDDDWVALVVGPGRGEIRPNSRTIRVEHCPHIGNLLQIANVLVHPSDHESHALAINEAWLARVPVVSCNYPVNQRFVELHGQVMLTVQVRPTVRDLADAILWSQEDQAAMVERAFEVANREYTVQRMGENWSNFIGDQVGYRPR